MPKRNLVYVISLPVYTLGWLYVCVDLVNLSDFFPRSRRILRLVIQKGLALFVSRNMKPK